MFDKDRGVVADAHPLKRPRLEYTRPSDLNLKALESFQTIQTFKFMEFMKLFKHLQTVRT